MANPAVFSVGDFKKQSQFVKYHDQVRFGGKKESLAGVLYRQGFSEAEGARTLNLRIDSPTL
jgi:hypothetical protein